jgi:hypothetical protein
MLIHLLVHPNTGTALPPKYWAYNENTHDVFWGTVGGSPLTKQSGTSSLLREKRRKGYQGCGSIILADEVDLVQAKATIQKIFKRFAERIREQNISPDEKQLYPAVISKITAQIGPWGADIKSAPEAVKTAKPQADPSKSEPKKELPKITGTSWSW